MNRWTRDELVGADLVWLLTITIAGREVRWSSRPVETVDADGRTRPYDGGLEGVDVAREIQGPGAEPALPTAALDLLMPADLDLPTLIEQGHDLAGCVGELSLWAVGTAHEDRRVYLQGIVQEPEYGDADEPVSLTLSAIPWESSSLYPPAEAVISADTWPASREADHGAPYPTIIGYPGEVGNDTHPGSIAYPVEYFGTEAETLVVADGRVEATSAVLWYDGASAGAIAITTDTDALGRLVSVMDISGQATAVREASEFHVSWRQTTGGGIQGPRGAELRGAGDVLLWAMRTSGRAVDEGAFAAVADVLNSYKIDASIEEFCDLYEWAVEHVLPLLPAEIVHTGDGATPALWRQAATVGDAVEHLDADEGGNVVRASRVSYSSVADIINDARISWAYDVAEDAYLQTTRAETPVDITDTAQVGHAAIAGSRSRYGTRATEIETQATCDPATAGKVIGWLLDVYAYPWRAVTYDAGQELGHLDAGDPVTITDTSLAWNRRPAMVRAVRWTSEATVSLDLILFRLPSRDLAPEP